jgi:hypothetical protein
VIVGVLYGLTDYNSNDEIAALAVGTTSCNMGTEVLDWFALPNNAHPVIAQNFYREMDGRLIQLGQSWVKHGFTALQGNACGLGCSPNGSGTGLGIGCSDPYGPGLNSGPNLGARSEINPTTGFYDGSSANNHAGHDHSSGVSHGCQVYHTELGLPGAKYFVEGHYIASDDAMAGNGNNNVSYMEIGVSGSSNNWNFNEITDTIWSTPAIMAWEGAEHTIHDSWPQDGRVIIGYKATPLKGDMWRYEYAIHNLNSDRGVGQLAIPVGDAEISNIGFHAVRSHDEPWSNDAWEAEVADGHVTWSTDLFQDNPNANAIRWGTMYNFWFDANVEPVSSSATVTKFKPGDGSATLFMLASAPAPGDCNNNGQPDDEDTISGTSEDCNLNSFPDECELAGNDCNNDEIPDMCQLLEDCNANGIVDDCEPEFIEIMSSEPVANSVDARIPHMLNDAEETFNSWRSLRVNFNGDVEDLVEEDFTITTSTGDNLGISSMTFIDEDTIRLTLNGFIPLGSWTTVTHNCTETMTRLGYLPGDVNGDGVTAPLDILAIVDALNGVITLPEWSTDINRSDITEPNDILTVIDLLNGAGEFQVWNGVSLD